VHKGTLYSQLFMRLKCNFLKFLKILYTYLKIVPMSLVDIDLSCE